MSVRDAELEFDVNENEYWMDVALAEDFYEETVWDDEDDWAIEDDDDTEYYDYDDEFAEDFIDWEIDFMDDEI